MEQYKTKLILVPIGILLVTFFFLCFSSCSSGYLKIKTINNKKLDIKFSKIKVNVYMEDSGSMDGYVNGQTQFKDAVYSYLDNISRNCASSLNLNYINSTIIPAPKKEDVQDFIKGLTPESFKARGGNRGTSDFGEVLTQILNNMNKGSVSILISDCILSPGKGKNGADYKINQQISIAHAISNYIKKDSNLAFVVYQLQSKFVGYYYDINDNPTNINDIRPYYIWIIGNKDLVYGIIKQSPSSKILCDLNHKLKTFAITTPTEISYTIRDKVTDKELTDRDKLKKDVKGIYHFVIKGNFRKTLQDDSYLKNKNNYQLDDPNNYIIENIVAIQNTSNSNKDSHAISILTSKRPTPGEFSLKLISTIPSWINDSEDDKGDNIKAKGAISKTFGLKNIIGGVADAFNNTYFTEIKLEIKIKK